MKLVEKKGDNKTKKKANIYFAIGLVLLWLMIFLAIHFNLITCLNTYY
jgi:hypothetical protein